MKKWILLLAFFLFVPITNAQERRQDEEEKRVDLESAPSRPLVQREDLRFDYGVWLEVLHANYTDSDNDRESADSLDELSEIDTRVWLKMETQSSLDSWEHLLYLRLKDLNSFLLPSDTAGGYDHDGPHLDYAYWTARDLPYKIDIGRRYFTLGRGMAYSDVHDGIQWHYLGPDWTFTWLTTHSLPHEDNIDTSVPGYSKGSDRFFHGLGLSTKGARTHQFYIFGLVQRDQSNEDPSSADQQYLYDSHYAIVGAKGEVFSSEYWVEIIKEGGRSHVFETNLKSEVDAWAANLGVEKSFEVAGEPVLSLEYAFGSGDSDRISVTDTEDGNVTADDNNFLYFGYFPSGYALAPRLSNIHIYRASLEGTPLSRFRVFRHFSLGLDYYQYVKHKAKGWISDLDASLEEADIGREVDITLSWQILSDLRWVFRFGHFYPGKAYPASANDSESYLSNSLIFTF